MRLREATLIKSHFLAQFLDLDQGLGLGHLDLERLDLWEEGTSSSPAKMIGDESSSFPDGTYGHCSQSNYIRGVGSI